MNLRKAKDTILATWRDFGRVFGRHYRPVETYRTEGADTLLLTMGSYSETAMTAIDQMREKGKNIGLLRLRLWRPFPFDELKEAVGGAKTLIILDRAISTGGPNGPVGSEIRAAFYNEPARPKIVNFVGGLGGRDITPEDFEEIVRRGIEVAQKGSRNEFEMYGVRE
jgi:pyruvate ferredoxin oxidoreductase alpha subunit